jgi:hypothetical protein
MDLRKLLTKMRLTENVDYTISDKNEVVPMQKRRMIDRPIIHPEVPAQLNEQGGVLKNATPMWVESNVVEEFYFENIPSMAMLRQRDGAEMRLKSIQALDVINSFARDLSDTQAAALMLKLKPLTDLLAIRDSVKGLAIITDIEADAVLLKPELKQMIVDILNA